MIIKINVEWTEKWLLEGITVFFYYILYYWLLLFYTCSLSANGIFRIYFYFGALLWIISIYFGMSGIRSKQKGISKYLGLLIILLILVIYGSMIELWGYEVLELK